MIQAKQAELSFPSFSPINTERLSRQNYLTYQHLTSGRTLTCHQARELYGISALNSRISELRNKHGMRIYGRLIRSPGGSKVMEYSLTPFPDKKREN